MNKKINYQLEIEGAAAISQSEIKIIPKEVGKKIFKAALSGKITAKRIKQLEAKSDHDTAALVESLSEKCTKDARPWIHYGLTSNDLVDTSNSMQMRDALQIIEPKVAKMASILAKKQQHMEKFQLWDEHMVNMQVSFHLVSNLQIGVQKWQNM